MTWREKLPELEGLPLLPCGAGEKWKAPIDVNTGKPLQNWQNLSFTPVQIMGMNGVEKSVGVRTGPDADNLLILDIDGDTAWEFCQQNNCSKRPGTGWKIWRSNAADRFKVAFQINDCVSELDEKSAAHPKDIASTIGSTTEVVREYCARMYGEGQIERLKIKGQGRPQHRYYRS